MSKLSEINRHKSGFSNQNAKIVYTLRVQLQDYEQQSGATKFKTASIRHPDVVIAIINATGKSHDNIKKANSQINDVSQSNK